MAEQNSKRDKLQKLITQFVKFGLVGVLNTLISTVIYLIFVFFNKDLYLVGNTVGFFISVLNAYYFNQRFVFKTGINTKKGHLKALLKTYLSYGITFLIGTATLYLLVDILGVSEIIAPFINLIITTPLNFIFNKFFSFKKK